jgi:hypothetical protein
MVNDVKAPRCSPIFKPFKRSCVAGRCKYHAIHVCGQVRLLALFVLVQDGNAKNQESLKMWTGPGTEPHEEHVALKISFGKTPTTYAFS